MSKDSILFRYRYFIFIFAFVCMSFFGFNKASASVSMPEDLQILYRNYINTYVQKTPTCNSYYIGYLDGEYYLYVMPRVSDAKYVSGDIEFYFAKNYYGDSDTLCAYVFSSAGLIRTDNLSLDGNFNLTGVHPSTPVFSNIDIYNTDGTVFFQQRPLAGSILIKAKAAALEKMIPQAVQVGMVIAIIAVSSLLLLIFLPKLVKKLLGLLVR